MALSNPLSLGGLSFVELAKRVWSEINEDEVFGRAAQLSYYFLLALFPLLLFLTALLGYFVGEDSQLRENLFGYLGSVLPAAATQLVVTTVQEITESSGGGKISFGILAALWAASNGMGAICDSLNVAYEVKETRPWWKSRLVAISLTVALAVLIISALVLVLYGHDIAGAIARQFRLGDAFEWTWAILQYPIVIGFVMFGFGLIYYFAPNLKEKHWKWITPGTFIGVILWLIVSFGFSLYLNYFDSYSKTYGSLGAVIILMLWFYLTGAAILIGGEINSEIENAAAESGAQDAKAEGEKAPGDKSSGAKTGRNSVAASPSATTTSRLSTSPLQQTSNVSPASLNRPNAHRTSRGKPLTVGKVALVAGSWLFKKLTRRR